MTRDLHPHQARALEMLRQSLAAGWRRPMLQAPTGFGKTVLGAAVVEGALKKGNRVIFTVPALALIDQTVEAFEAEGLPAIDIGVMQGGHIRTNPACPVQVASVQTLQRRRIPPADVVVVDEAHRLYEFYIRWMTEPEWRRVPFIGLSATPWTRGLGKHFDDLLIAATTADLIEAGYLSRFRVFAPSHPDLSGVRVERGDYVEADLSQAMNKDVLVADIVATWKAKGENRSTLCFAVDRAHAKHLEQQFAAAGVPTGYIDAYTPASERAHVRDKFASGSIRVVCNVGCLTTGVDWDVRCIILARPTKSEMLFVQIIGRGLRTAEGKEDCLILDHSDNHLRLGFVTDIHHAALDDGRERQAKAKSAALPKECPRCSYLKPARVASCPNCGFRAQLQAAGVLCEDGELVELTSPKERLKIGSAEKAGLFGMLKSYARRHRYREGWAAHKFREATGVWPNAYKLAPELDPSPEVLSWIKSRQIAWAKSRGGDHARPT